MDSKLKGERFVLEYGKPDYPEALYDLKEPPDAIYGIGSLPKHHMIGVIGARKATPYGLSSAGHFAKLAAMHGIAIVSGGARGCDSAAHKAAIEAKAPTIAVFGGGCDQIYPKSNFKLFQQIIDAGGAVISEHSWDTPPLPFMFRLRNRIIAALAKALIIVEAGLPSGTFSTADAALEMNREILVVPGSIASNNSHGSNMLIYQGALPIVDDDVFESCLSSIYGTLRREYIDAEKPESALGEGNVLIDACLAAPTSTDDLLALAKQDDVDITISKLLILLADAEKQKIVSRYPDGKYGPYIR